MTFRLEVTGETLADLLWRVGIVFQELQLREALQKSPTIDPSPRKTTTASSPPSEGETSDQMFEALDPKGVQIDLEEAIDLEKAIAEKRAANPAPPQVGKSASSSKSTKGPKLEDLKTRLSEVLTAAAARGWDATRRNNYARKLLGEYGVAKVGDIKPEQYAAFLDSADDYVAGLPLEP